MCGRYVSPDDAAIEREFNLVRHEWQFPSSFNVAPTQSVSVIRVVDGQHHGSRNPHRMPAILKREDQDRWLNGSVEDAKAVLSQYDSGMMVAQEVSTRVNTPKNNDVSLIEPV